MTEERAVGAIATAAIAGVALVLAAASLISSSNGGSGSAAASPADATPAAASAAAGPAEVAVDLTEFSVGPERIEVASGGTIQLTNSGVAQHDLEIVGTDVASTMLDPGGSEALAVGALEPGVYEVRCTVPGHDSAGMTGELVVVGDDAEVVAVADGDAAAGEGHDTHGGHGEEHDWEALDAAMHDTMTAFPAETEGVGNQPLEPEVLSDGTKRFELTAEIIDWEVEPGKVVEGWAYNGQIPGPMIKLDVGDEVEVVVHNELPLGTDVHWHGIKLDNENDGVAPYTQDLIAPGESFTYRFTATESYVSMYHPHHHAQMKVPNGMWGTVLIGDVPLPEPGSTIGGRTLPDDLTIDQEIPMVVNDAGTIGMSLNGKSFPATHPIVAQDGDNILLHYYNEGLQIHPMHLHGVPQLVVAKDGFPLDQPYWADTVNIAPGERYSVLIPADVVGTWVFHCHVLTHAETHEGMYGMVTALIIEEAGDTDAGEEAEQTR